jgi:hypothetical protein
MKERISRWLSPEWYVDEEAGVGCQFTFCENHTLSLFFTACTFQVVTAGPDIFFFFLWFGHSHGKRRFLFPLNRELF